MLRSEQKANDIKLQFILWKPGHVIVMCTYGKGLWVRHEFVSRCSLLSVPGCYINNEDDDRQWRIQLKLRAVGRLLGLHQ